MDPPVPAPAQRPRWQRAVWLAAGVLALATGIVGIVLPLLPTTPFVLLAAACFTRGSTRWERWLLAHPRFGPLVADWRAHRAIPLRAKQLAWAMMAAGSVWAWWLLPPRVGWLPGACCTLVAVWMARLPTRPAVSDTAAGTAKAPAAATTAAATSSPAPASPPARPGGAAAASDPPA